MVDPPLEDQLRRPAMINSLAIYACELNTSGHGLVTIVPRDAIPIAKGAGQDLRFLSYGAHGARRERERTVARGETRVRIGGGVQVGDVLVTTAQNGAETLVRSTGPRESGVERRVVSVVRNSRTSITVRFEDGTRTGGGVATAITKVVSL
jgi:hypothetical protein